MGKELLSARGLEVAVKAATAQADAKNTRVKVQDGNNLMLIVRPGGGASWVLQYRMAGKRKPITLGTWPEVGLKTARDLAARARDQVVRGVDPLESRRAEALPKPSQTVRSVYEVWTTKIKASDVYRGNIHAAMTKDVLPVIGAKAPADVTRQDVLAILRTIEARGSLNMLRRVRMWTKQLFECAIELGVATQNPAPAGKLNTFLQHDEGHFPSIKKAAEVGPLMRAIRASGSPVIRAALMLSAYVWQRPTEIREAQWHEFDLAAGTWLIPAERMKGGKDHLVPLAPQVVQLLRQHAGVVGSTGWLFPGHRYGKPISEATIGAALESMGFKGRMSPHGFRAMARTIGDEHLHIPVKLLEKQLAHKEPNKVQKAYNHAEYWGERVAMMAQWADWVDAQGVA